MTDPVRELLDRTSYILDADHADPKAWVPRPHESQVTVLGRAALNHWPLGGRHPDFTGLVIDLMDHATRYMTTWHYRKQSDRQELLLRVRTKARATWGRLEGIWQETLRPPGEPGKEKGEEKFRPQNLGDGPRPPDAFVWRGQRVEKLTARQWQLLSLLWDEHVGQPHPAVPTAEVVKRMYANRAVRQADRALKELRSRCEDKLLAAKVRLTIDQTNGQLRLLPLT
jgi:hypothetical protein